MTGSLTVAYDDLELTTLHRSACFSPLSIGIRGIEEAHVLARDRTMKLFSS